MSETEPYRPSNGTEGCIFMEAFCHRCKRDKEWREHELNPCEILSASLCFDIGDVGYPKEWVRDVGDDEWPGTARCTAFEREEP